MEARVDVSVVEPVDGRAGGMVGREMVEWKHGMKSGRTEVRLDGQDGENGAR